MVPLASYSSSPLDRTIATERSFANRYHRKSCDVFYCLNSGWFVGVVNITWIKPGVTVTVGVSRGPASSCQSPNLYPTSSLSTDAVASGSESSIGSTASTALNGFWPPRSFALQSLKPATRALGGCSSHNKGQNRGGRDGCVVPHPQRDPPGEPEPPVPTEIRGVMTTLAVKTLEGAAIAERSIGPPPVKR